MGTEFDSKPLELASIKLKEFIGNPENLNQARVAYGKANREDRAVLEGWVKFFEAHTIENPKAMAL